MQAKTSLNNRSEYLRLKQSDIYKLAQAAPSRKHKLMYIRRSKQVEQLADTAMENAFVLDGLLDSIMSLDVIMNANTQNILNGLCTAAITNAMDNSYVAMQEAQEISDIVAQPLDTTSTISDSELQAFMDEGITDTECTESFNSICQSEFPTVPTTTVRTTHNGRNNVSNDRSDALDTALDSCHF